jgi:hypothetical protein
LKDFSRLLLLIAVMVALHLSAILTAPMMAGEAYYWLWGKYLAPGYFDHPPMVALMAALSFGWVNGSVLAARSSSLFLAALTLGAIYLLARSLYPEGRTAWRSALLLAVVPLFHAAGMLIQPDTALLFFMTLTWLCFWKASRPGGSILFWILSGITAGGALLTKFHAWVLLPPLYVFLFMTPGGRARLKTPGPWLALVLAFVVLSPNLLWNARHDWLNYTYQWRRSDLPESTFEPGNVFLYLLGPLFTLSPVVYVLMLGAVGKGIRRWLRERDERVLFLLCAGLPLPLFLGLLSFVVTISLHWPSAGYIPLLILAVALVEQGTLSSPRAYRWALGGAIGLTVLAHLTLHTINLIPSGLRSPIRGDMINTTRFKAEWNAWPEIGREVRAILDEANKTTPTVIMARDWHLASSLAFYSERPTEAFVYYDYDAHNFKLWMQERGNLEGMNAIVFINKSDLYEKHSRMIKKVDKYVAELSPLFDEVSYQASLIAYTDGAVERYWGVDVRRPRHRELLVLEGKGFKGHLLED